MRFQFLIMSILQNYTVLTKDLYDQIIVPRVVKGKPATLTDVPYQISFKMKSRFKLEYTSFCGGTLIKPKKILSAAHCFEEKMLCKPIGSIVTVSKRKRKYIAAVAGNLYNKGKFKHHSRDGQWRDLRKVIYPSTYRFPDDDIALAFTLHPFKLGPTVATIPYASIHKDYSGTCRISGFGRTSDTTTSAILLYADVEVISSSVCTKLHRRRMSKFICTSDLVSDVHKGDSGGPLICKNTGDPAESGAGILVGIVSGNQARVGSFFTRISAFKDFIKSESVTITGRQAIFVCISVKYIVFLLF